MLAAGAHKGIVNRFGLTASDYARRERHMKVLALLAGRSLFRKASADGPRSFASVR